MNYENDNSWCKPYLSQDEYILWSGKPEKGRLLSPSDAFLIPFSIFWCGFAIFWESSVVISDAPMIFRLWGIPFVIVGLYMVFGRFVVKAYIRKRTAYVITNRKLIRMQSKKIDMLDGNAKSPMQISVKRDGSGSITFGAGSGFVNRNNNYWSPYGAGFALENIPDVNRVQHIIQTMDR